MLDFIAIYIKEMKKKQNQNKSFDSLNIIKGLLKALQVAHADKNTMLFDRIKSVISILAKGTHAAEDNALEDEDDQELKSNKIIVTEIMNLLLK